MSRLGTSAIYAGFLASLLTAGWAAPRPISDISKTTTAGRSDAEEKLYMLCSFYPKPGTCERVYQRAMKDRSIPAQAVRAEYTGYVRYLGGTGTLTDADRRYLRDNNIRVPAGLSAANRAGLHNVINDASLAASNRAAAVNNFLSRAVQAEIYCSLNSCTDPAKGTGSAGV